MVLPASNPLEETANSIVNRLVNYYNSNSPLLAQYGFIVAEMQLTFLSSVTTGTTGILASTETTSSAMTFSAQEVSNQQDDTSLVHQTFFWITIGLGIVVVFLAVTLIVSCTYLCFKWRIAVQNSIESTFNRYKMEEFDLPHPAPRQVGGLMEAPQ